MKFTDKDIIFERNIYRKALKTETQASESVRKMWKELVAMLDELLKLRKKKSKGAVGTK